VLGSALAVATALAWIALSSVPASANPSHTQVITAAGSDTTEKLMDVILNGANEFNIHVPATLHTDPSNTITIPGDTDCNTATYAETAGGGNFAAPNGSGAGRDALKNSILGTFPDAAHNGAPSTGGGCVDIARSSAEPRPIGTDNATFQYYAMALDQITWASPSLQAPASMTLDNLRKIYNCTITNWNQLPGGGFGPIQRFFPQSSSGTGATFISKVLQGIDPHGSSSATCPAVIDVQENRGNDPLITGANYQNAIFPYSNGKFIFQATNATNPTLDIRAGARVGGLTMVPSDPASATYGVRWTGSAFFLNNASVVVNQRKVSDMVTNGTTTITSTTANFTQDDVGKEVSGTNLPAPGLSAGGTPPTTVERISSVTNATTAVLSLAATGSGAGGSLTIGLGRQVTDAGLTNLSSTLTSATAQFTPNDVGMTVQFLNANGGTLSPGPAAGARITAFTSATQVTMSTVSTVTASNVTLRIGPAPATEVNPNLGDTLDQSVLPGVRYLYNVLDSTEVEFAVAQSLVGFQSAAPNGKSDICNGLKISSIRTEGFLDLLPKTIGTTTGVTCRVKSPT
jgi:ABC-type phosphate transport system substrate-binding protein